MKRKNGPQKPNPLIQKVITAEGQKALALFAAGVHIARIARDCGATQYHVKKLIEDTKEEVKEK